MCLHGALCSIPFNLICNMTTFRKKKNSTFDLTPGVEGVCVCKDRICLHIAAFVIPFNLI